VPGEHEPVLAEIYVADELDRTTRIGIVAVIKSASVPEKVASAAARDRVDAVGRKDRVIALVAEDESVLAALIDAIDRVVLAGENRITAARVRGPAEDAWLSVSFPAVPVV
jgi:gamma-glutamyl-gamma-aminobutyrate hydrolase PuuD